MINEVDIEQDEMIEKTSTEDIEYDEANEPEETRLNKFKHHFSRNVDKAKDKWEIVKIKFKKGE